MPTPISLVVAGRYPIPVHSIALLINQYTHIHIARIAHQSGDLLKLVRAHVPQLVLTETHLLDMDCAAVIQYLKASHPVVGVVVFGEPEEGMVLAALGSGADGFVSRRAPVDQLVQAILTTSTGRPYYSPEINRTIKQRLHYMRQEKPGDLATQSVLTERERQVLELICREYTTKEIAHALQIEQNTVNTHRQHLLRKTGAKNIAGLVLFALKQDHCSKTTY